MNQKKKVLFLLEAFDKGGIEKVTLDIVNHLDPEKYDITVQTFWYGGHCQSQVRDHVTVRPFFFKRYVRGIIRLIAWLPPRWLYRLFVRGRYDVEIAASDGGAAKVIAGSTNQRAKKICWVHMDVVNQGSKLKELTTRERASAIYSKFDQIICVSENARAQFNQKFGFENRTQTVHNPLPVNQIQALAKQPCEPAFDKKYFNIAAVGSLIKVKGFDRLIRVCGKLANTDRLPVRLYIVGAGQMETELRQLIAAHTFDNIFLLGFQSNPYPYIKHADLLVCSSYSEAFSLVIGESFALKAPVLGTRCSGVCEWLEQDHSGLIVENDEESLYAGIKAVATDPDLLEELNQKAVRKSEALDFDKAMARWEKEFLA